MGCQIALDARHIVASDNDVLATWSPRRQASYGATAAGTAQPTYKASSINGRPSVQFDGTSDCMDFDSGALAMPNNATGMVAIGVVVCDNAAADATQNAVFFSNGLLNSSTRFAMRGANSSAASMNGAARRLDADSIIATGNVSGTGSPAILQVYTDWANNLLSAAINGGTASTNTFTLAGNCSATNSVVAKLGGQATSSARLSGRVGAIAIATPLLGLPLRKRIRMHFGFSFRIATA